MAYTFLKAQGINVGNSKLEKDKVDMARELMEQAKKAGVEFALTTDFVITQSFTSDDCKISDVIPDGWESLDIGPKTIQHYKDILIQSQNRGVERSFRGF